MRSKVQGLSLVLALSCASAVAGGFWDVLPAAQRDARVPELPVVTAFAWGEGITDPDQVVAYARALAAAAPQRVRLVEYARSLEGRPLVYLILSSPETMAALDAVRARLLAAGDPRTVPAAERERLLASLPAVAWILCSVHGDETSGGDAGLALAYHLASATSPEVEGILAGTLVIIDPVQNPDGRARFLGSWRQARGIAADAEPYSAEHSQPWPGGRVSHDLFDLNRDWFAQTHPETAGRVAAMLEWPPMVVADLHEMGAEQGYFFAPPAKPRNPLVTDEQAALWDVLGRANAAAFDAHGWRYWTREVFDSFYPGYGESWPFFSGAVGMTFEQASSRGLATRLKDGSILRYAEAVQHHLVAAYTTCRTVAEQRGRFVTAWSDYRAAAVEQGRRGPRRAFVLEEARDPLRAWGLADLLARQGVEVHRARESRGAVKAGAWVVPLDQPLGRLAAVLLEKQVSMGEPFEKEQERRAEKRMPDEIYDLTAWPLGLLWGVPVTGVSDAATGLALERLVPGTVPTGLVSGDGTVAYLLRWNGPAAVRAVSRLLRAGVKVAVAEKPFTLGGARYESGTAIVRRAGNPEDLRATLAAIAKETGVTFVGTTTGYVEEGTDLGSNTVHALEAPRVALLWDAPTSPTGAGHLRYAVERTFGYPVSAVRTASLAFADLSHFDVILLPDTGPGGYDRVLGEDGGRKLASWVRDGGVLVAVGDGAAWLCGEKVGLLATKPEKRGGPSKEKAQPTDGSGDKPPEKPEDGPPEKPGGRPPERTSFDYDRFVTPDDEQPPSVPGAVMRVTLDAEHFLAAGFPDRAADVLVASRLILSPLKLDKGVNVGVYAGPNELVQSGFVLKASREQLPAKAYLVMQRHGRGKVVAFAEDPATRGFTMASMMLLANAVFLAPAF
jgi:hypothetical protein